MLRTFATAPFVLALAACATVPAAPPAPVEVGIIAINDFHGAIEPPRQSVFIPDGKGGEVGIPAGGAAWLASAVDSIRARHPHTVTVAAGDLTGASQFASSVFLDEPAVGALNRIGLEFNALGNHEFDRGTAELQRLQSGGCEKTTQRDPCAVEPFGGAKFRYLAANVTDSSGKTLFPATGMKTFGTGRGEVKVGFVGLPLKGVPGLVLPQAVAGLTFGDEADAINRESARLKSEGADAVVVMIHQGGRTAGTPNPQGCDDFTGEILPILDQLSPQVDVIVSGHTHWAYVCERQLPGRTTPLLLTSAGVYGALVTDITLAVEPGRGVVAKSARNVIVQSAPYTASRGAVTTSDLVPKFEPRADVAEFVARYVDAAKQFSARKVGSIAGVASRPSGNVGGSIGNIIADAQLGATQGAGAQIAFMNPFGIRAPASIGPGPDGMVTYGELYQVQPFSNELVTVSLTGAELKEILEQGFDDDAPVQVLSPSAGFAYSYDLSRPVGSRVVAMTLGGTPIDPAATYRVTVSNFLAQGGDSFTRFTAGRDATRGGIDLDALEAWLAVSPARAVPSEERTRDVTPK